MLDPPDEQPGDGLRHFLERLAHRSQAEGPPLGHRDVVEADDGNVARDVHAEAPRSVERAERDHVVAAEEGRRSVGGAQQLRRADSRFGSCRSRLGTGRRRADARRPTARCENPSERSRAVEVFGGPATIPIR